MHALTRTNHELQAVPSVSPRHHIETKFLEMEEETPALAQLLGMKTRALQRRAVEVGVGEDALEDAEDKSELIVLIMAHMQSSSGAAPSTMSEGAVEPAQSEQPAPDGPRGGSSPALIRLIYVSVMLPDVDLREQQIRGSGGSLEPPGPLLEPPRPLLTHLHTDYMAYSE